MKIARNEESKTGKNTAQDLGHFSLKFLGAVNYSCIAETDIV